MNYWLVKSEPITYSINQLKVDKMTSWEGVRNYQARNYMRDEMKLGDLVLFYHSNCEEPAIVGVAKVIKESHPDKTQWDKKSKYYDEKSTKEKPRWFLVDLEYQSSFLTPISLSTLRMTKGLENMRLLQKGSRLSVLPVSKEEFQLINKLSREL